MTWPFKQKNPPKYFFKDYLAKEGDWIVTHNMPNEIATRFYKAFIRWRLHNQYTASCEWIVLNENERAFFIILKAKHNIRDYA